MPDLPRLARLAAALLLPALSALPAAAQTPTDGPAIIVLDGSGSMWGEVGTEKPAKFDLARQALRAELSGLSPRVRLGLLSFGQRRRADCSDVEVLAPAAAGPPERILAIADRLSPKGKGPLSLALREAAKQIPAGEAGAIIAIHDGPDNCGQDPCAAAAEIAKANPKARIFLIGFGLPKADAQRLQCVAQATQGRVLEAQSSAALAAALSDVLMLANLEKVDPATGLAVPAPQEATPPAPAGVPGLRLAAALSSAGEPLKAAVRWTVAKADAPAEIVKTAEAAELALDLEPGSYIVEARLGEATATETLEVKSGGPTVAKVSLGAGVLNVASLLDKDGKPLANPLITLFAKTDDGLRPVWVGRNLGVDLVLPAGGYQVRVEDGFASETTDVTVKEGMGADVRPAFGTGQVTLSAVARPAGEPVADVVYVIEEDDPDSPAGRREVTRTADAKPAFTLPAGTYYVTARSGIGEAHDRIALGNGDAVEHVMSFNLVPLTVTASGLDTASGTPRRTVIRILTEATPVREIARANDAKGVFRLPPARYRIEAEVSGLNVKAHGIVDLTSGRGGGVQLKLESGEVALAGPGLSGRHWRIEDGSGRTVLHSGRAEASGAQLAPGHYTLITYGRDRESEQDFEIKAGERRDLVVEAP
jgi:Ca-activated chloride channel family protein